MHDNTAGTECACALNSYKKPLDLQGGSGVAPNHHNSSHSPSFIA